MHNMQEILINVDSNDDKIITLVENGKLVEKYEETNLQNRLEGNIYVGKVENILLGMQAAFINIGEGRNTFIHIRDIIPKASNETGNKNESLSKHDIKNYIKPGIPILVQVKRDSTNKKGARVSTHISLSGRFVVIMPDAEFITVSQKIGGEEERNRLKEIVKQILPKGYGAIVRTAAEGKKCEEIEADIQNIIQKLEDVDKEYQLVKKQKEFEPKLLYKNDGMVSKLLIDVIDNGIDCVLTNNSEVFQQVNKIVKETHNEQKVKVEFLQSDNIFTKYDLMNQLESVNNRKIWLKCGGFITIDKTEALTAIDVNSGKYIGGKDLEKTIFTVNKEATIEIAKQLRIRDIGGIIIIDYIDMEQEENRKKIIEILNENLKKDRSKTQVIGFTPLDLLEMTRKHMCSND